MLPNTSLRQKKFLDQNLCFKNYAKLILIREQLWVCYTLTIRNKPMMHDLHYGEDGGEDEGKSKSNTIEVTHMGLDERERRKEIGKKWLG